MPPAVGIDISGYQPDSVPGEWLFVVVKATEGGRISNPRLTAQWRFAEAYPLRGLYHYARPRISTGREQADVFADVALGLGFRPGIDLWQLDCEGALNDSVPGWEWANYVNAFMARAHERLGAAGFLYCGLYFFPAQLSGLRRFYNWWLPDYGHNDGNVYPLPAGVNPVLHQYSSAGALDRNVVHDPARWAELTAPAPVEPAPKVAPDMHVSLPHPVVSFLRIEGRGAWVLTEDGGVWTMEGNFYGAPVGKPYWTGRKAAQLRPNPSPSAAGSSAHPYVVIASSGEVYGKTGF